LGGTIERIALAPGLLAATDPVGGKVHILDSESLKVKTSATVAGRPFGIVWDGRNRLFWVTTFEGGRLLGMESNGTIKIDMAVEETPRGLALLSDGRLLITHAMTGKVSLLDTTQMPPKPVKTITLAHTEDPVQTVSQGAPRLLDQIAVSPDETEAWLPHVLWNLDHTFLNRPSSRRFGAVAGGGGSVRHRGTASNYSSRSTSEDVAAPASSRARARLFRGWRSRRGGAVSGVRPLRAALSQGAARAASARPNRAAPRRRLSPSARRQSRHRGCRPGRLYVQNAASLDMSRFDAVSRDVLHRRTGRRPSPDWWTTTAAPRPAARLRLFHSANDFPKPMAGDFWMSYQSCLGRSTSPTAICSATPPGQSR
jgi:hypothetical protein